MGSPETRYVETGADTISLPIEVEGKSLEEFFSSQTVVSDEGEEVKLLDLEILGEGFMAYLKQVFLRSGLWGIKKQLEKRIEAINLLKNGRVDKRYGSGVPTITMNVVSPQQKSIIKIG